MKVAYDDEVTEAAIAAIEALVSPEFAIGNWIVDATDEPAPARQSDSPITSRL